MSNSGLIDGHQAPSPISALPPPPGSYHAPLEAGAGPASSPVFGGQVYFVPYRWPIEVAIVRIAIRLIVVGTAGAGSATCSLGLYRSDQSGLPAGLIQQAGTVDLTATTGLREIVMPPVPVPAETFVWAGFHHGLAGTLPQLLVHDYAATTFTGQLGYTTLPLGAMRSKQFGWRYVATYTADMPQSPGALLPAVADLSGVTSPIVFVGLA